ncbi:MAG: hypothetical protein JWR85_632 [Marmoricola sp.]|nr:hypothetical protein [Marmoricola sp.]
MAYVRGMSYEAPPSSQPGVGPYSAPPPPTTGKATTSLVLGICSIALCGLFLGIPAMILARSAKREIRDSHGQLGGEGVATAGFVTGVIGTVWSALAFGFVVLVFVFGNAIGSAFEDTCSTTNDGDGSSLTCE